MKLTKKLQAEILKIYNTYWDAYLAGDMKTFASMLDDNIKVFGTAVSEVFNNKTETVRFYKATADQMTGKAEFRNRKIKMNPVEETLLIHEQSDLFVLIENEWIFYSPVRVSAIFVNTPKGWKLTHQHGSFPDSRAESGEQIGPEKIKKENLELREAIKRRTAELENKNRELEIEASLEKVRTIAMGMRKPDDMLDVCKTISLQLQSLGVKEIRNVQTAIIYVSKSIYINYEYYAKHKKQFITEVDFKSHYYQKLFVNKMLKGTGEIFTKTIKGKKVKEWYEHQKTTNQFADRYLGKAKSLSYYWFSLGPLALGISTYSPLSEEQLNLFIRFRNVFELAYQRYLDIEKAEAQAREAKIEAALEKVRSSALAMKEPADMVDVCHVISDQLQLLGVTDIRNVQTAIINEQKVTYLNYQYFAAYKEGVIEETDFNKHPTVFAMVEEMKKSANSTFSGIMKGKELITFREWRKQNNQFPDPILDKVDSAYYYFYSIGLGGLGLTTYKPLPKEGLDIFKRFHNVFTLAYRRFIDIEKAEAQAREAKIEAALERLRAKSMSMQKSDELHEVLAVLFEQFDILEIRPMSTHMTILDIENNKFTFRETGKFGNRSFGEHTFDLDAMDTWKDMVESWRNSEPFTINRLHFSKEKLPQVWEVFHKSFASMPEESRITPNDYPDGIYHTAGKHAFGYIGMNQIRPATVIEEQIVIKFASEFGRAYQRFLDLQKAEAQAREAKIEAALEKVRGRAMAMRSSEDLGATVNVFFKELKNLGFLPRRCGVAIIDEARRSAYNMITTASNIGDSFEITGDVNLDSHFVLTNMLLNWKVQQDYFLELDTEQIEEYYRILRPQVAVTNFNDARQYGYYLHFKEGMFYVWMDKELQVNDLQIFRRFTQVIGLTYRRHLDLQKAETQAREARIEAALERVRSRSMGMQKSEELKNVIQVVYEQFVHLKINVDHAGFVVDYTPKGDWHFWIADEQDIPSKITHPYFESVWANQFNEAKEKGEDFFATNLNFEEKNKFYNELLSYVPGLPEASKDFYLSCPGLAATTVLLENVSLYMENFSGIPYTDEENKILMRFGKVFQQTYTRFLDLQRAEAQNKIIQAENDRKTKELEEARQLQLSMLPKKLPKLPNLDIAVYMKTATEVGGDYYDFNIDGNGILTFVVGDATGHGMMSGMMVSIMKSFFISNKANIELKQFFENSNNSIKDMQLGRLMMGLIGIQITTEKLIATNAGMPSLLYFRNKSQKAGEFVSNNLPLGGMKGTQYLLKEISYEKGDTLLLMSDGFAELKNPQSEQYGYTRVKEQFRSIAHKSANDIIEELKSTASQWLNGAEPDDDVTFVVIKAK